MKKRLKSLAALIAAATICVSLLACATAIAEPTTQQKDPVTLNIYFFGDENAHYRNVEPVIEEFEKRTADTLNTKLNVVWTSPSEYGTNLPLWLSAEEEMDLNIVWDHIKYAKDGALLDLSKYFNNPDYPGLQKAFSEEFINDNKILGGTYVIPIANSLMDMEGVWYRKDLLEKHGLKDIESYDDLYAYLEVMLEKETSLTPFGNYGNTAFFKLFTDPSARQLKGNVFSFIGNFNPKQNYIDVQIADDGKSVKAIAAYGDPDSEWEGFNAEYGKQFLIDQFEQCVRFNKFVASDVLSANPMTGRNFSAGYVTIYNFKSVEAAEKAKFPEAELGFWPIFKNNQEMALQGMSTDGKAWNFIGVFATSKNVDRTMEFLDWVYANQANNDLFSYGIEGVNWEAVGDNQWKVPEGVNPDTNYKFPGYQLTWNPTLNRIPAGLSEQVAKYFEYQFKPDTYKKNVLAGFVFDQTVVKNEIAKCNTVLSKYIPFLLSGVGDVNENLSAMNAELKSSGVDIIKEELKNQINTFLASK